jgi:RNA polymerase sigma factor for flagellar operon FliA
MTTAPCVSREWQISALVPSVHRLAKKVRAIYGRSSVDEADLIGAGYEAIVRAYDRYDASRGVPYEAYAKQSAVNAMRNAIRAWVPGPEGPRDLLRHADAFRVDFAAANGRFPTRDEIEARLPGYVKAYSKANLMSLAHLDAPDDDGATIDLADPTTHTEDIVLARESRNTLKRLLLLLSPRQWDVIKRHYFGGERIGSIARSMGVHQTRVSQLHQKALCLMRKAAQI